MDTGTIIIILFTLVVIMFSAIFLGITVLFIRLVINKSKSRNDPEFLQKQKDGMLSKINKSKNKLIPWNKKYLKEFSNKINYNYSKGFAKRFNGTVTSNEGEPILTFRRIDRGFSVDSKIMATTSADNFYLVVSPKENKIYINDIYFGKIVNNSTLINASDIPFGTMNRDKTQSGIYSIKTQNDILAKVIKNSDRRMFLQDPINRLSDNPVEQYMFEEQDVSYHNSLIHPLRELNDEEYKWVLAIAIFELVYYGIDF